MSSGPILPRGHLSSEAIDLLLLSALSDSQSTQANQHLEACESCRLRWQELNDDKRRFEQFVFPRTLPKVEARAHLQRAGFLGRLRPQFLVPGLAFAAVVVAVVVGGRLASQIDTQEPYVGTKGRGQPTLEVFAVRGVGAPFSVPPGAALQPRDRIRFAVNGAGAKYLIIGSLDSSGLFSVYFPFGGQQSKALEDQRELPGAVELDATLGAERIGAAFSDEPISAAQLEAVLKGDISNPLLPGARVVTMEFVKVAQ